MMFLYYKQLDSMDCAPTCLQMVAKFYGKTFSLQTLRSRAFIARTGVSMLGMLTASIISLISPFLTQSLVDTGIGNSNMAFVVIVLVAQLILTLSQTANGLLRNWISLHVTSRVSISLISDFLIKLMKFPISFCSHQLITSCEKLG